MCSCVCSCMCSPRGAYLCHCQYVQAGVGVSCVLVCRRPWMLSRLQLGTAMVHVQCRIQQQQASYKLNGHALKTSTFTLASISMSSRVMKQATNTHIMLGCQSEQKVQGIFRLILNTDFFFQMNIYIYIYKIGLIPVQSNCSLHSIQVIPSPPYTHTEGNCSNKVQHARTPPPAPSPSRRYMK